MIQNEYPEEGELVVGTINKVQNFGAFVSLDEYPNKEGFIHISELLPAGSNEYVTMSEKNKKSFVKFLESKKQKTISIYP